MEITLSCVSQLKIPGYAGNAQLTVADGATVEQLLATLGIQPTHIQYIKPFINNKEVSRSAKLCDGDSLYLFLAAGGG